MVFRRLLSICCMLAVMVGSAWAGDWRFPVGLAYVDGFNAVKNRYENNLADEGYITNSSSGAPVGLMFQPYYQFDFGLGVGVGLGPIMAILGDRTFFDLPIEADARFMILPTMNISPYVRAGVKKHIASGSYVNGSSVGVFGGAGVEFFRLRRVGMGIEMLIDNSSIEFDDKSSGTGRESIKPSRFLVCVSAVF